MPISGRASARPCACRARASCSCMRPRPPADLVVDLKGDRLLPGLINAHDHLQLNSFPPLNYPAHYRNATEWICDFNARLRRNAAVAQAHAAPRTQRLLAGGLKNLLSGVTTVAHHDPLDPLWGRRAFRRSVVQRLRLVALAVHRRRAAGASRLRGDPGASALDHPRGRRRGCGRPGGVRTARARSVACGANTAAGARPGARCAQRQRLLERRCRADLVPLLEPAAVRPRGRGGAPWSRAAASRWAATRA